MCMRVRVCALWELPMMGAAGAVELSATVSLTPPRESTPPCSFSTPSTWVAHECAVSGIFPESCPSWLTSLQSAFSTTELEERQMPRTRQDREVSSFCSRGMGL